MSLSERVLTLFYDAFGWKHGVVIDIQSPKKQHWALCT